jgi:hypothetical protein
MLKGGNRGSTQTLRERLGAGESIAVAGYRLAPELAASIARFRLEQAVRPGLDVHWLEAVAESGAEPGPAARRLADALGERGVGIRLVAVASDPFWMTVEIAESRALLDATLVAVTART